MKMNIQAFSDPFLRTTDGLKPRIGLTAFDEAIRTPGPSLTRSYESVRDKETEQKNLPKNTVHVLAKGAAVGRDTKGKTVHFYPDREIKFLGFLEGQTESLATVRTRGAVVLRVEGVSKNTPRGTPVFASGPNHFHTGQKPGAAEIGVIRYVEANDRASVFFKQAGDLRPPYLKL